MQTQNSPPEGAPGCYGAASVFSHDSDVCRGCSAYCLCGAESLKTLETIAPMVDVRDLLKKHQRAKLAAAAAKALEPKKIERPAAAASPVMPETIKRETKLEPVKIEVTDDFMQVVETMPKKAKPQVIRLFERGLLTSATEQLQKGINPFENEAAAFFRIAAEMLLAGGFTRSSLKDRYIRHFGWAETTAAPHVSIVVAIAGKVGIAVEQADGTFVIPKGTT